MSRLISDARLVDRDHWAEFVRTHPDGTIFQSPEMYEAFRESPVYRSFAIFYLDTHEDIKGLMVGTIQAEPGIKKPLSRRCIVNGGPLVINRDPLILQEILEYLQRYVCKRVIYSQLRNYSDLGWADGILKNSGFQYEDHLNILIPLDQADETWDRNVHKSRKRNYRRAANKGVQFNESTDPKNLETHYNLIRQTYRRIKLPLAGLEIIRNALEYLAGEKMIRIFSARIDQHVIAVRLVLLYDGRMYDWYAGSDERSRSLYPNDFLIYSILRWGNKNGYRLFDFGGAGKPGEKYGVREHKEKFGGEFTNYGRYNIIHKPTLFKLGKLGLHFYQRIH